MTVAIREYEPRDAAALRECVVELQEFERRIDPRLRLGEEMADAHCAHLHDRCREARGQILVATVDGVVAGFASVIAEEPFTNPDEPPGTYAVVSDLVVLERCRGRGIGRRLLVRAEVFARDAGATELRIGVLSANAGARALYADVGFEPYSETLAKRW